MYLLSDAGWPQAWPTEWECPPVAIMNMTFQFSHMMESPLCGPQAREGLEFRCASMWLKVRGQKVPFCSLNVVSHRGPWSLPSDKMCQGWWDSRVGGCHSIFKGADPLVELSVIWYLLTEQLPCTAPCTGPGARGEATWILFLEFSARARLRYMGS